MLTRLWALVPLPGHSQCDTWFFSVFCGAPDLYLLELNARSLAGGTFGYQWAQMGPSKPSRVAP